MYNQLPQTDIDSKTLNLTLEPQTMRITIIKHAPTPITTKQYEIGTSLRVNVHLSQPSYTKIHYFLHKQ